jgi:hypothetical protein
MKETHKNTNLGIALGLCFGVTFGLTIFDNLPLGMLFGLAIGASFGAEKDKKVNAQIEEQGYIIVAIKKTSPNTYTIRLTNKHGEELQLERHTADIDSGSLRVGKVVYLNDDGHIALAYDDK